LRRAGKQHGQFRRIQPYVRGSLGHVLRHGGPRSVVAVIAAYRLRCVGRDGARPSKGPHTTERVPPEDPDATERVSAGGSGVTERVLPGHGRGVARSSEKWS